MNARVTVETQTKRRRIGSPHGVNRQGGVRPGGKTFASGETLSFHARFCQLEIAILKEVNATLVGVVFRR
jgi:hypothetical protein